ncbi:hypothetical protein ABZX65_26765 [Streptomyces sp. NPDC003300]|uniref:hypothetical protein n=1 Tax=unclassified Streptomyces TaxID=2593676 RepID=UPI0033A61CDE
MTEYDPEPVLNKYIERVPAAHKAVLNDPPFKVHMEWLDRVLRLSVPAMRREGLDPRACNRVVNTIVYGAPEPDAAIERIADQHAKLETLKRAPAQVNVGSRASTDGTINDLPPLPARLMRPEVGPAE